MSTAELSQQRSVEQRWLRLGEETAFMRTSNYSPPMTDETRINLASYLSMSKREKVEHLTQMINELNRAREQIVKVYNSYPAYSYHMHYTLDNLDRAVEGYEALIKIVGKSL